MILCDRCRKAIPLSEVQSMDNSKTHVCQECYKEWGNIYDKNIKPIYLSESKKYFVVWDKYFKKFMKSNNNPSSRVGKI